MPFLQLTIQSIEPLLSHKISGIPELVNRVTNMLTIEHGLCEERKENFKAAIVPGSQDGLAKLFDMLLQDNNMNSSLLVESPTYSGSLAALDAKGCNLVGVDTDELGLDPAHLGKILDEWGDKPGKPRVL